MTHRQRRAGDAGLLRTCHVIMGAAPGKVQDSIDFAGLESVYERSRKRNGNGAIDDAHFSGNSVFRQFTGEIGGTILSGEIEQRCTLAGAAHFDEPHKIAQVAVCRYDVFESGFPRGLGAAMADREERKAGKGIARGIVFNGFWRIRAGDDDSAPRTPRSAAIGSTRMSGATSTVCPRARSALAV